MHTRADKTQENKRQSIANAFSKKKQTGGESTFKLVDNRSEAIIQRKLQAMANNSVQVKQLRAIQSSVNELVPIQLMTMGEQNQVIAWQAGKGLSISDYSYNPNTNLAVYYTQIGTDVRTVEIHVHLDAGKHGRVQAANMRWKGGGPPGIGLVATGWGDKIVNECIEYWMPDPSRLDVRQGADL